MLVHLGHHGLGERPPIEGVGPLPGQGLQHPGQRRVAEPATGSPWGAIRQIEVGAGVRILGQIGILLQQGGQPWADDEALLGERDGRLEQLGPGQLAIALMGQRQRAHRAGDTDRTTAHHAVVERHRLAVPHKQLICRRGGGGLPAIHRAHPLAIPHQQQGATADAGGLGLHQGQHQLDGDGGIHRAAAGLDDLIAGIHRQRVGGGHHEVTALPALLVGPAAGRLGGEQGLGRGHIMEAILGGATGEQAEGHQQAEGLEGHDTLLVCFFNTRLECGTIEASLKDCLATHMVTDISTEAPGGLGGEG
ncbi:hypothetical protein D3C85_933400 [compost metagenome]